MTVAGPPERLELGIHLPNSGSLSDSADYLAIARDAEAAGFDSLWVYDHIFTPVEIGSTYPRDDGKYANQPAQAYFDALTTLSMAAGATTTIKLGTRVLVPVYRNPVVLAKQLATIATLSGGRLMLGVGAGWMEEEFDIVGVPLDERYGRLTEHIALMRQAWSDGISQFEGRYYSHPRAGFFPAPGHIPVLVGGFGEGTLRRVARWADGWAAVPAPGEPVLDDLAMRMEMLRGFCEEEKRNPADLKVVVGWSVAADMDDFHRLAEIGVDMVDLILEEPQDLDLSRARSILESYLASSGPK